MFRKWLSRAKPSPQSAAAGANAALGPSGHVDTFSDPMCTCKACKKLIREEDPANPLSDSRIAELLSGAGIPVARRTVAKYRESMRLAPSNERRRDAGKLTSHAP